MPARGVLWTLAHGTSSVTREAIATYRGAVRNTADWPLIVARGGVNAVASELTTRTADGAQRALAVWARDALEPADNKVHI